ncbi:MAG: extracellular solute-binding protein [Lachnospiraceae bacterium]|nr:extracellular solute-binding protein [Lachnospiraceae bacterium]
MKKRIVSLTLVGVLAASLLAGCGSSSSSSDTTGDTSAAEETTETSSSSDSDLDPELVAAVEAIADVGYEGEAVDLTFWGLSSRQDGLEGLTEIFNEANENINVTVACYDTDGIKDACKTAAQSSSMPSMWFNWGGSLGQYYVDNGVTYDLTAYAEENGWSDTFNSGVLSLCTLSDQVCGYPTSYNVLGIYYRTDIFEQYGLEVPATIEEFEALCDTLLENGITPISTAGLNGWHVMRLIEQLIEYTAGADLHDELQAMTTSWDCDAVVEALTIYQTYCESGYFPDGFVTANPDDTYMAFAMGTCAMDVQGQWYDAALNNNGADVSVVSWFPFPNGTGRVSAFAEMVQFSADLTDDELEAAMLYTQFMNSVEATDLYPNDYNLPLPLNDAEMPDAETQPNVESLLNYSSEYGTFTITDQAFPSEVADVLFNCQDAIAGGSMTPEEAATQIQAAIEDYQAAN